MSTVFSVGKDRCSRLLGVTNPKKSARVGTDLRARVWREGGKVLTLHEPFRKAGAGEVLWLISRVKRWPRPHRTLKHKGYAGCFPPKNHWVWGG